MKQLNNIPDEFTVCWRTDRFVFVNELCVIVSSINSIELVIYSLILLKILVMTSCNDIDESSSETVVKMLVLRCTYKVSNLIGQFLKLRYICFFVSRK